ncbi:MAG: hypothetical protein ACYCSF_11820 [Acidimicrobiales bacterium]
MADRLEIGTDDAHVPGVHELPPSEVYQMGAPSDEPPPAVPTATQSALPDTHDTAVTCAEAEPPAVSTVGVQLLPLVV